MRIGINNQLNMSIYKIQTPFIFTVFGASGDLAKLKLFPAFYSLAAQKRLPAKYLIVGYARTKKSKDEFAKEFEQSIRATYKKEIDNKILEELISHVHYYSGQYDDLNDFKKYREFLKQTEKENNIKAGNKPHLTYFSVPPVVFQPIIENLGLSRPTQKEDLRLIIEKPFGNDEVSATDLFHFIAKYFEENQVYLLDHFLGKAGVQSILNLRQSNRVLNMLLKGPEIANIQITAFEDFGVGNRIGYFERVGIIRDMFQSHLLQILALITMSIPISDSAASLQREKYSIISAIKAPKSPKSMVLGQYKSYKKENGVKKGSNTETFAALKLFIDQEAWYSVPIFIRTGKMLKKKQTYIVVEFKKFAFQNKDESPNLLVIQISPDEKISIQLVNKYRSGLSNYETITTSESLACSGEYCLPEHGLLILDIFRQNRLHFLSFPEILASWRVTEQLCKSAEKCRKATIYDNTSEGPKKQHDLTKTHGYTWHNIQG
jgi:glucose-6-phosphate 1-dehydrogenase